MLTDGVTPGKPKLTVGPLSAEDVRRLGASVDRCGSVREWTWPRDSDIPTPPVP